MEELTNREKILTALIIGIIIGSGAASQLEGTGIDMENNPIYNLEVPEDPLTDQAVSAGWVEENAAGGIAELKLPVGGPGSQDEQVKIPEEDPIN